MKEGYVFTEEFGKVKWLRVLPANYQSKFFLGQKFESNHHYCSTILAQASNF